MGFINIYFTDEDKDLNKCVEEFDKLYEIHSGEALTYTHIDLAKKTNINDPALWKKFLLNPKIKEWRNSEQQIMIESEVNKLIRSAATSGSTATVQTLNALLSQKKEMEDKTDNNKVIIYNFIPLTQEERKDKLINVSETIPAGIRRAIVITEDKPNNSEK